jgi:AraC-like DNA-binding protein
MCEAAPEFGVTAEQCLNGTDLVLFDLYRADTRVTLAQELRAIENFLALAPPHRGLGIKIGQHYRPEVFGIWGYAILSSPTFGAALKVAADFANLSFIIAPIDLDDGSQPPLLTFDTAGLSPPVARFVLERQLTVLANFSDRILPNTSLSRFSFQTRLTDPDVATTIEDLLGLSVVLDCDRDAVTFTRQFLGQSLPRHDPAIMRDCLEQCRALMRLEGDADTAASSVSERVLMAIEMDSTILSVARKLDMTERTLRRRLSEEGTSFRQILTDARLAVGHELLSTAGLDVSTVAWRAGYAEPSSFVRAFSKKYGYSPGRIKKTASQRRL